MARTKVKLSSPGMKSLLNDAAVRDLLTDRAQRVLAAARANAPVSSGEYRNSLKIVQDSTDRAAVRVITSAPHGAIVESRTGNLSRALDPAGGS